MQAERWIKIENILQSALDQPPDQREAYLLHACEGDQALRTEVQALLGSDPDTGDFLETPALNMAAVELAAGKQALVGSLVGPYKILRPIGAGGMGEVYLAHDTRLGRQIALKILPPEFAADRARAERFELEARAASALDHPNVLVVHDVGVHNGLPFIASEYLQGETLRDRLASTSLPVAKAVDFAIQIARALAAAHDNGIVHRDLKPENIFVTAEGRIKLLDFGLAKLVEPKSAPGIMLTDPGTVMGTPGYLAPEQIRGYEAVPASDVFSFGCILYEMLTRERAFLKESHAETMAAVAREEPPPIDAGLALPSALLRTISHCLEKSPRDRFQSARDLAFALEGSLANADAPLHKTQTSPSVAWMLAAVLFLITAAASWLLLNKQTQDQPLSRFQIPISGNALSSSPAIAVSPDGKYIAFLAMGSKGKPALYYRALDEVDPHPVPGTDDAQYPFWSPNSRFLAFHVADKLKTIEVATGTEHTICSIRGTVTGSWSSQGVILLSTGTGPLLRMQSDGDHQTPATRLDSSRGQRGHWWPWFLPDSRHFIYTVNASTLKESGIFVGSLDNTETIRLVPDLNTNAIYVPSGYILYTRDHTLLARPFDIGRLRFSGSELSVAEKVKPYYGYSSFAASQNGTLIYRGGDQGGFKLAWFDRTGKQLGLMEQGVENKWTDGILPLMPAISPDGTRIATLRYQPSDRSYGIWVTEVGRNTFQYPVTVTRNAEYPVWSLDGDRLVYSASPNGGARDLYVKHLGEDGVGKLVFHSDTDKWPLDWSSDGRSLLFYMNNSEGQAVLWVTSMIDNSPPTRVQSTPLDVKEARFSPDGRWLAYTSTQSDTSIIFIQDFPKGDIRLPISGGASNPQWRHDGNELFYLSVQGDLMSVPIHRGSSLVTGSPQILFRTAAVGVDPYTVSPDGQRFLMQIPGNDTPPVINVTLNWQTALKK